MKTPPTWLVAVGVIVVLGMAASSDAAQAAESLPDNSMETGEVLIVPEPSQQPLSDAESAPAPAEPIETRLEEPIAEDDPTTAGPADPVADETHETPPGVADVPGPAEEATLDTTPMLPEALPETPSPSPSGAAADPDSNRATWWPLEYELPPFWVASSGSPIPVSDCATPDDVHVMTGQERTDAGLDRTRSFDVIQWDVAQASGTITFDLAGSTCGHLWGVSRSTTLSTWSAEDVAFVSFDSGRITLDVDAINRVRPIEDSRALAVLIDRPGASTISLGMNVSRRVVPVEPEPWSCFSDFPAPPGVSYDLPDAPVPFAGSAVVGQPLVITLGDLVRDSDWQTALMSPDTPLVLNGPAADGSFSWTPEAPGKYTFDYHLGTPNCVLGVLTGSIHVAAQAITIDVPTQAPNRPFVVAAQPATLAETGVSQSRWHLLIGGPIALLLLGVLALVARRNTRDVKSESFQ